MSAIFITDGNFEINIKVLKVTEGWCGIKYINFTEIIIFTWNEKTGLKASKVFEI